MQIHGGLVPIAGGCCSLEGLTSIPLAKQPDHRHTLTATSLPSLGRLRLVPASQLAPSRVGGTARGPASSIPAHQHLLPAQATRLPHVLLPAGGIHPLLLPVKGSDALVPGILKKQQNCLEPKGPKISC